MSIRGQSNWESNPDDLLLSGDDDDELKDPTSLYFSEAFAANFETEVHEAFHQLDADNSGSIDEKELREGVEKMGVKDAYIPSEILATLKATGEIGIDAFREVVRVQRGCFSLEDHFKKHPEQRKKTKLSVVDYTKETIFWWNELKPFSSEDRLKFLFEAPLGLDSVDKGDVTRWVNIEGLDPLTVREIAIRYKLDALAIDDALQVEQRPKMNIYDHGVFIVVPMLRAVASSFQHDQKGVSRKPTARRTSTRASKISHEMGKLGGSDEPFSAANLEIEVEAVSIFVVEIERTVITIQAKYGAFLVFD